MKKSHQAVVGIIASAGLGLAIATAYAQPEGMGGGMGSGMMGGMDHGKMGSMEQGRKDGAGHGAMGGAGPMAGQQLMTPEERAAFREQMRNAKTPEERQKLAQATHAEMQKRAKEKGISLPEHRGPHTGRTETPGTASDAYSH